MRATSLCLVWLLMGMPAVQAAEGPDLGPLAAEGIELLGKYLAIDTSNPPGQELEAVRFLQTLLEGEGIPSLILESAPGRASLFARLKGSGNRKPLILLHHVDVVPVEDPSWGAASAAGMIRDGYVWGRGAIDMKGQGIVHLMTFLDLHRRQVALDRDVIFLATADEENGSRLGLSWLMDNHFDLLQEAGMVLTEGGLNLNSAAGLGYIGIEVSQKTPLWLRLTVRGPAGHASTPYPDPPAVRLVRALNRILGFRPPIQVDPTVARFFRRIAPFQSQELRPLFEQPERLPEREELVARLPGYYAALLRNTLTLTILEAGQATNVIPSRASAELDCRLLPTQDPQEFIQRLTRLVDDPAVQIEPLLKFGSAKPSSSSVLFDAVQTEARKQYPRVEVGLSVLPGFSDAHLFRERGIAAFGLTPFRIADSDSTGIHGANERLSIEAFRSGLELFSAVVGNLVRPAPVGGTVRRPPSD